MSANAWAMLLAALALTPAGSADGPARTKSLVKIAFPYWLLYEKPPATNWFSSEAAWTISALGPPVPFSAFWIAAPVADPVYLNVNCGYAVWKLGLDHVGDQPRVADVAGSENGQSRGAVGAGQRRHQEQR